MDPSVFWQLLGMDGNFSTEISSNNGTVFNLTGGFSGFDFNTLTFLKFNCHFDIVCIPTFLGQESGCFLEGCDSRAPR